MVSPWWFLSWPIIVVLALFLSELIPYWGARIDGNQARIQQVSEEIKSKIAEGRGCLLALLILAVVLLILVVFVVRPRRSKKLRRPLNAGVSCTSEI